MSLVAAGVTRAVQLECLGLIVGATGSGRVRAAGPLASDQHHQRQRDDLAAVSNAAALGYSVALAMRRRSIRVCRNDRLPTLIGQVVLDGATDDSPCGAVNMMTSYSTRSTAVGCLQRWLVGASIELGASSECLGYADHLDWLGRVLRTAHHDLSQLTTIAKGTDLCADWGGR